MDTELQTFFKRFTKAELSAILYYFDQEVDKNAKKADLVGQTALLIGGNPREWMYMLPESDILLLRDLVSAEPGEWIELPNPDYPSILELLSLIYVEGRESEGIVFARLDDSLFFPVVAIIDELIDEKRSDGSFEIEHLALGLLNIYGVITAEEFVHKLFNMLDDDEVAKEEIIRITESRLVSTQRVFYNGEVYLVSPYAYEYEKLIDGWKEYSSDLGFADFTREQVVTAGRYAPFCAFGYGTPEYEDAKGVLEDLGYNTEDVQDCLNEVWVNAQYAMDEVCAEAMFSCVNDMIDYIDTFEAYKSCINAIADYANSVPKWLLKGHTSAQTGSLKISIKVDEAPGDEGFPMSFMTQEGPDEMPGPLNDFYKYNMAVRHVKADDPCPCGSGLSYRRCHGKNLN